MADDQDFLVRLNALERALNDNRAALAGRGALDDTANAKFDQQFRDIGLARDVELGRRRAPAEPEMSGFGSAGRSALQGAARIVPNLLKSPYGGQLRPTSMGGMVRGKPFLDPLWTGLADLGGIPQIPGLTPAERLSVPMDWAASTLPAPDPKRRYWNAVGGAAPYAAAALLGPEAAIPLAAGFAVEGGGAGFDEARAGGADVDTATGVGSITGAVSGLSGLVGMKVPGGPVASTLLKVGEGSALGGVQDALNTGVKRATYDPKAELNTGPAMFAGGLGTGAGHVVGLAGGGGRNELADAAARAKADAATESARQQQSRLAQEQIQQDIEAQQQAGMTQEVAARGPEGQAPIPVAPYTSPDAARQAGQRLTRRSAEETEAKAMQQRVREMHAQDPSALLDTIISAQRNPEQESARLKQMLGTELSPGVTVRQWANLEMRRRSVMPAHDENVVKPGATVRVAKATSPADREYVGKGGVVERVFEDGAEPHVMVRLDGGGRQVFRAVDMEHLPTAAHPGGLREPPSGAVEAPAPEATTPAGEPTVRVRAVPQAEQEPPPDIRPRATLAELPSPSGESLPEPYRVAGVTAGDVQTVGEMPVGETTAAQQEPNVRFLGGESPAVETSAPSAEQAEPQVKQAELPLAATAATGEAREGDQAADVEGAVAGASNTVFTRERRDAASKRLLDPNKLRSGISPEDIADLVTIAGFHIEAGARDFKVWAEDQVRQFGERVRPALRGAWDRAFDDHEKARASSPSTPRAAPPLSSPTSGATAVASTVGSPSSSVAGQAPSAPAPATGAGAIPAPPVAGAAGGRGGGEGPSPVDGAPPRTPNAAAKEVARFGDSLRRMFAASTRGPDAKTAALSVRANRGELDLQTERAREALKGFSRSFDKAPEPERLDFIYRMEEGAKQGSERLSDAAFLIRKMLDAKRDEIRALGTGKLEHFIQDYFPHIWERPEESAATIGQIMGRKPLSGPGSFLKQRTIPTTREGVEAGLRPVTTNPVELALLKLREMDRYLMGQRVLKELDGQGLLVDVPLDKRPPPGWERLNDKLGQKAAPEEAAEIINNYLSPGLRGNAIYDAYRSVGNAMNQAQLGLSAFHLGFTSVDAAVSRIALGVEQIATGRVSEGARSIASSPFAPLTNYLRGDKVLREYLTPGSHPEFADIVRGVADAGGKARMDTFYKNNSVEKFMTALREGRKGAAALHSLPAAMEASAKPIMEWVVPRQKLGVFADLARFELERLPEDATTETRRDVVAKAWDSVDNRMGQLVYDNLFWSKTLKDLSMASVRSLGWNIGTARELGGGAVDIAKMVKAAAKGDRVELSHKAAYIVALTTGIGLLGAITTYLMTGEPPKEERDYFMPRTGRKNPDGTDDRINFPSYVKDVIGFTHQPAQTVTHKLHPLLATLHDMLVNKDFYGDMIANPDEWAKAKGVSEKSVAALKIAKQEAEYLGKQFVPFGFRNAMEAEQRGQSPEVAAANFVGVTPAPRWATRSDAMNRMTELLSRRGIEINTPEQRDQRDFERDLQREMRDDPKTGSDAVSKALRENRITRSKAQSILRRANEDPLVSRFKKLSALDAIDVYMLGTQEERATWRPFVADKWRRWRQNGGQVDAKLSARFLAQMKADTPQDKAVNQ